MDISIIIIFFKILVPFEKTCVVMVNKTKQAMCDKKSEIGSICPNNTFCVIII
jgi:hypothetical protein